MSTDVFYFVCNRSKCYSRNIDSKKKGNMRSTKISTPGKYPITNQDVKSPAMLHPRKILIKNQYSNIIINKEDPIIPPLLSKYPTGYDLVQPKMSLTLSFSGMYQKSFIYCRNKTNS